MGKAKRHTFACPYCSGSSRVYQTYGQTRKRKCLNESCKKFFYTKEILVLPPPPRVLIKNQVQDKIRLNPHRSAIEISAEIGCDISTVYHWIRRLELR